MDYTLYPGSTVLDKKVIWESSHPEYVEVSSSGQLKANKVTEDGMVVTITATTRDGGFTDTCEITVIPPNLAFIPILDVYTCTTDTIDLMSLITYNADIIELEDIQFFFEDKSAYNFATITDNVLTFEESGAGKMIKLICKVDNANIKMDISMFLIYSK